MGGCLSKSRAPSGAQDAITLDSTSSSGTSTAHVHFGYPRGFKNAYKLERLLGHGSFGRTFVATHLATGFQAAVKAIQKSKTINLLSVAAVRREVEIMQVLSGHENVVEFYEAFEDNDFVYIVMELCTGGELLNWIASKKGAKYTERDAAMVVRQMLRVVAGCHLKGIVHRDIKPENFLFTSHGDDSVLKVIDFGMSDYIRPGKTFDDVVGSTYYLAPEVLKRRSGPASDVWSVGVITYIMLCGRWPFCKKTESGIFLKVLEEEPDFSEKPWPLISPIAKDFVGKLLVKDPLSRLTAAQALSHLWIREGEAPDVPLDILGLAKIRQFVGYNHLKKIALKAVTSSLNGDVLTNLQDQFNAIDTHRDGILSLSELHEALAKDETWHLQESKVLEVLNAMDTNRDGQVDFEEFAAAALHVRQLEGLGSTAWHSQCLAAFKQLDMDRDGYLTPDDLRLFTSGTNSITSLIDEADLDKDGRISLLEFETLLRR